MRVAGYIRVSTAEQVEGYSLDAQRHIIDQFAAMRGWEQVDYHAEEGVSAFTDDVAKRPVFAAMLAAAERGEYDAIIVHKLDRFARSLVLTLTELAELERAGVSFVSVAEQFDFTTPIGRVVLAMLASFAEYYSRNLSTETKKGLNQRRLSGAHVGGVPWGARRDQAGRLEVDPAKAESLALVLALAAEHGDQQTARLLNERGVSPPRSRQGYWLDTGVHSVVRSGAWLLDQPAPWPERYAAARARPRLPRIGDGKGVHLLSGLMRCACGGVIVYAGPFKRVNGPPYYGVKCVSVARPNRLGCPYRKTGAAHYERLVTSWLFALPDLSDVRHVAPATGEARAELAERRRRLGLALVDGMLTEADYRARKAALDAEEARLPLAAVAPQVIARAVRNAQLTWHHERTTDHERNAMLRTLVSRVVVTGRAVAIEPVPGLAALLANRAQHQP